MQVSAVGMPWYHEPDYNRLREMFDDGDKLHPTFHEWLQAANLGFERLKSKGAVVEKVYIIPDEFSAWCTARGKGLNAEARMNFANETVARKYLNQS
jgi:hypothetical protein